MTNGTLRLDYSPMGWGGRKNLNLVMVGDLEKVIMSIFSS